MASSYLDQFRHAPTRSRGTTMPRKLLVSGVCPPISAAERFGYRRIPYGATKVLLEDVGSLDWR